MAAVVDAHAPAFSPETFLAKYVARLGEVVDMPSPGDLKPTLEVLTLMMDAQTRSVPFENIDVALRKTISMEPEDVTRKMLDQKRGGYCFEQNTLLKLALELIGFTVTPLLCRVRWGKRPDENTAFTHMCLKVDVEGEGGSYLADVGFAGTNSIEPISLNATGPLELSDGTWWTEERDGYVFLSMKDREEEETVGRDLYCWSTTGCMYPDLLQANHWSCTKVPGARFTGQLFVAITSGQEKLHIMNNTFVRRVMGGSKETTAIESTGQLEELLRTHFRLDLGVSDPETLAAMSKGDGVARYLQPK